jgi:hypothetical protein
MGIGTIAGQGSFSNVQQLGKLYNLKKLLRAWYFYINHIVNGCVYSFYSGNANSSLLTLKKFAMLQLYAYGM